MFKLEGLIDAIAEGKSSAIMTRMALTDSMRSSGRAVIVDADKEDFTRTPTPFSGIPDLIDRTNARLAAAAGMPVTVLFGVSPAGMNATGESDIRGWYDKVKNQQQHYLKPKLRRLVYLMMLSKEGPSKGVEPKVWDIRFPSLWQMSPTEKAKVMVDVSAADKNWVDAQIVTPEEAAMTRAKDEDGLYCFPEIDVEARKALMASDAIAAKLGEQKEEPVVDPNADPTVEQV